MVLNRETEGKYFWTKNTTMENISMTLSSPLSHQSILLNDLQVNIHIYIYLSF